MRRRYKIVSLRSVQNLVKNSAESLDKELPEWHKKIDLGRFDINFAQHCLVGQLGLSGSDMDEKRGFHLDVDTTVMDKGKEVAKPYQWGDDDKVLTGNKLLTRLWKHQIKARLKNDKKSELVNKIMDLLASAGF